MYSDLCQWATLYCIGLIGRVKMPHVALQTVAELLAFRIKFEQSIACQNILLSDSG